MFGISDGMLSDNDLDKKELVKWLNQQIEDCYEVAEQLPGSANEAYAEVRAYKNVLEQLSG